FILFMIITSYVIGQVCLAFYTATIEVTRFDKLMYRKIFVKRFPSITEATDEMLMEDKGKIFKANKELYFHFIERDVNLSTLRWNYSSAFSISSLIYVFYLFVEFKKMILIMAIISFVLSFCLMLLH